MRSATAASPRPARAAERVSLLFLAAGVATYAVAFDGMRRLEHATPAFDPARKVLFEGLAQYLRYEQWSYVGLSLVIAGLVGAVGASVRTAVVKRAQKRAQQRAASAPVTTPSARADA